MNNIVLLILLAIILIFFITLVVFVYNYCLYTICTPPPDESTKSHRKIFGIKIKQK